MSHEHDLLNLIAEEDPLLAQALLNSAEQDREFATLQPMRLDPEHEVSIDPEGDLMFEYKSKQAGIRAFATFSLPKALPPRTD